MRQSWTDDRMDDLVKQVEQARDESREQLELVRAESGEQFKALNRRIDIYSIALVTGPLGIIAALIAS